MPTHWNEESMLQQPEAAAGGKSNKKTVNMPVGVPDYTLRDEAARSAGHRASGVANQ